jgi:neurofilament heavy polypeptide
MNGFRIGAAIGATLACFALNALAQGTTITTDPKKAPKAEEARDQKSDPKKAEPKKADPKKVEPKKAEPKKTEPKKAPPKKAPPKKPVDTKVHPTAGGGTVQKYEAGKAPDLQDSKGNIVNTSPDAYDISSATKPAPKKK